MSDAGTTTATTATTTATTTPGWWESADPELRGHIQSNRWHEKDPAAAALAAAKDHREAVAMATRIHKIPPNEIARIPANPDDPAWGELYERIGAPKEKAGYTFDAVKHANGDPVPPEVAEELRAMFHEARVPARMATKLAERLVAAMDKSAGDEAAEAKQNATTAQAAIDAEWGGNKAANVYLALQARARGNFSEKLTDPAHDPETYADRMKMLLALGQGLKEAPTLMGAGGGPGQLTADQALARKRELFADRGFVARWNSGDATAVRELASLDETITKARMEIRT